MKSQVMNSGLRVTLGATELECLLGLARHGFDRAGDGLSDRQYSMAAELLHNLSRDLASVKSKRAAARAAKSHAQSVEEHRRAREYHDFIDDHNVWAILGDWADISPDPDHHLWTNADMPAAPLRDQAEIRRNVWRVSVSRGRFADDSYVLLGSECTQSAERADAKALACKIIKSGATA